MDSSIYKYSPNIAKIEKAVNEILATAENNCLTIDELKLCLQLVEDIQTKTAAVSRVKAELFFKNKKIAWEVS
jgi:hypothetical protein